MLKNNTDNNGIINNLDEKINNLSSDVNEIKKLLECNNQN
jgi:hypothetical protein